MQLPDPTSGANAPQPGWYPDPWQVAPARWWDGLTWTGFTTPVAAPARLPGNLYDATARLPAARDDIRGGWIALLGFFGAIALSLIFAQLGTAFGARTLTVPSILISQFGLWSGLCMTAYIVSHRRPGGRLTDLGLRVPTGSEIGIGIGIGFAGIFIATRVAMALRYLFPDNGGSHLFTSSRPSYALVLTIGVLACVGAPLVEELFFRGVVQPVLMRNLGTSPAIGMQAILFGLAHFELGMTFNQAAVRCGTVMVLGVFLGWLRVHTGRLGAGMVAHATYNSIVTIITLIALLSLASNSN
ncbi:MAG TPA: CPBP family glutamic-type intramembrane protease [Acidimicrobiia bacterium]|nr:CPBP family glutamic-type intramembrane protease [Acidimicrobiia bacterium]